MTPWDALMVQWLRTCLATQGTAVRSLIQDDPTRCSAAELWSPHSAMGEATAARRPGAATREGPPLAATGESPSAAINTQDGSSGHHQLPAQHGHSNRQDDSSGCDQANLPVTATTALKTVLTTSQFPNPSRAPRPNPHVPQQLPNQT